MNNYRRGVRRACGKSFTVALASKGSCEFNARLPAARWFAAFIVSVEFIVRHAMLNFSSTRLNAVQYLAGVAGLLGK